MTCARRPLVPLVTIALAASVAPAQTLLYSTGPQKYLVSSAGTNTNLGLSSGSIAVGPHRWLAAPFALPDLPAGSNRWRITNLVPAGFTPAGVVNASLNYILWSRVQLEKPVDGDQLLAGFIPFPASYDDPSDSADNSSHPIPTDFTLGPGDYYLTVYASHPDNPSVLSNFAWFVYAPGGIPMFDSDGPFRWRSASFPSPGFERWTLPGYSVQGGDDPNSLWNVTFRIFGEAIFDPGFDSDGDGLADGKDGCPLDPAKSIPGQCGCGHPEADLDGDGTSDCVDADDDGDLVPDTSDGCPIDPFKSMPGVCGCGVYGRDHDADGLEDCCLDAMPTCCLTDMNGDGKTSAEDLAAILFRWGELSGADRGYDLDGDGVATGVDLSLIIAGWGDCP